MRGWTGMLLHIEACHDAPQRNRAKILQIAEIDVILRLDVEGFGLIATTIKNR